MKQFARKHWDEIVLPVAFIVPLVLFHISLLICALTYLLLVAIFIAVQPVKPTNKDDKQ